MTSRAIHLCGQAIDGPGHICAFFTSRDEEYDTLVPYFAEGIEGGENVLNVVDADRMREHRERIESAGLSTHDEQFSISTSEDTYLRGGRFEMERMVSFVEENLKSAAAAGRCVRTAGWMDWVHRDAPGTDRAIEYEARMNLLLPNFDCTFVCVYDLAKLKGEMVVDIMATHPYVILKGQLRKNSFFVPPEIYLRELLEKRRAI